MVVSRLLYAQVILFVLSLSALTSCATWKGVVPIKKKDFPAELSDYITSHPVLSEHFTGFVLYDPITKEKLVDINGDRAFTPASNTKLLTYLSARKVMGDEVRTLAYAEIGDMVVIHGVGDPSHLGQYDQDTTICSLLSYFENKKLFYDESRWNSEKYGSGWSWDDYNYAYQKEISPLPLYDNEIQLFMENGEYMVVPELFNNHVIVDTTLSRLYQRAEGSNLVAINPYHPAAIRGGIWSIPMHITEDLTRDLISDACDVEIDEWEGASPDYQYLYRDHVPEMYRALLRHSDNYVAEQLLQWTSYALLDTMDTRGVIDTLEKIILPDHHEQIRWVDGSGLSRYNLITPNAMIAVLTQLDTMMTIEERHTYLPYGEEGTISSELLHPIGDSTATAYIYAKTGTLSNNHNLSGWITTKSGHTYLFSFMNNHYLGPKKEIVKAMSEVLSRVYWEGK